MTERLTTGPDDNRFLRHVSMSKAVDMAIDAIYGQIQRANKKGDDVNLDTVVATAFGMGAMWGQQHTRDVLDFDTVVADLNGESN